VACAYLLGFLGYIWYPMKERSNGMLERARLKMNPYRDPGYSTF
jgi:hypothetical protein